MYCAKKEKVSTKQGTFHRQVRRHYDILDLQKIQKGENSDAAVI